MRLAYSYGRHLKEELDDEFDVYDAFDEHIGNFNSNPYGVTLALIYKKKKYFITYHVSDASVHSPKDLDGFIVVLKEAKKLADSFPYAEML